LQTAVSLLPVEVGCLADPDLSANLRMRRAFVTPRQNEGLPCLRKFRCPLADPLLSRSGSLAAHSSSEGASFQGGEQRWQRALRHSAN
jgi:hypothetical protein